MSKKRQSAVQQAYNTNNVNWAAVQKAVSREGTKYVYYPDTLAYVDLRLRKAGIPETLRNIILGNIFIESGGSPSRGSTTGKTPTYFGLLQWDKRRLPNRYNDGMRNLDYLIDEMIKTAKDPKSPNWGDGGKGTNFKTAQEAFGVFWGLPLYLRNHSIPRDYNMLLTDYNKQSQAFVDGHLRPLEKAKDNVLRATAANAVRKNRGLYKKND